MRRTSALLAIAASAACGGTTGSAITRFTATASGPADVSGDTITFTNDKNAQVTLTRAVLFIGAVYLNEVAPATVSDNQSCISVGTYAGEVFGGLDIDILSPDPQPFPTAGEGTADQVRAAEIWLSSGDVNAIEDSTVIFDVAGAATQAGINYPFTGQVTIGANRVISPTDPALPGSAPICHQRIVSPIAVNFVPTDGGTLVLQIDPRVVFADVDFSTSVPSPDDPTQYVIPDVSVGIGAALFRGIKQSDDGLYTFTYLTKDGA